MKRIWAANSMITPQLIRLALSEGNVGKIALHPIQVLALDQLATGSVDPLVPEVEVRFVGDRVPIEQNVLVPEDQLWFVDENGESIVEIHGLAIPICR